VNCFGSAAAAVVTLISDARRPAGRRGQAAADDDSAGQGHGCGLHRDRAWDGHHAGNVGGPGAARPTHLLNGARCSVRCSLGLRYGHLSVGTGRLLGMDVDRLHACYQLTPRGELVHRQVEELLGSAGRAPDYPTVPALAIYEALRSSQERGVLPYKHLWDGRSLRAVGG
jgi:hypothetical protein